MATYRNQLSLHERRLNRRVTPTLLTYVSFDGSNGGMVLDVGPEGLAIATAFAVPDASLLTLTISADRTHELIEIAARVEWISESRRHVGLSLVEPKGGTGAAWELWVSDLQQIPGPEILPVVEPSLVRDVPAASELHLIAHRDFRESVSPEPTASKTAATERAAIDQAVPADLSSLIEAPPVSRASRPASAQSRADTAIAHAPPSLVVLSPPTARVPDRADASAKSRFALLPHARKEYRSAPLLVAAVLVIASVALGIVIDRRILTSRAQNPSVANAALLPAIALTSPAAPFHAIPFPATSHVNSGSDTDTRSGQNSSVSSENALTASGAPIASNSTHDPIPDAEFNRGVGINTGEIPSNVELPAQEGGEFLISPPDGNSPFWVDLAQEVVVNAPSIEIRSRRRALLRAVSTASGQKTKKTRVVFGPLISVATPQPPPLSKGAEQVVTLRVTIGPDGHVSYVDPLKGAASLIPGVVAAIRTWQYEPSFADGQPIEMQAELTVKFPAVR